MAQSNERVSELLRNLGNNSPWLTKPELVEITAGTVALSARDQRRVSNFTMRVGAQAAHAKRKSLHPAASAAAPHAAAPRLQRRRSRHTATRRHGHQDPKSASTCSSADAACRRNSAA